MELNVGDLVVLKKGACECMLCQDAVHAGALFEIINVQIKGPYIDNYNIMIESCNLTEPINMWASESWLQKV